MRCAVHTDRDAVAVCLGCGAGVCNVCRVTVAGLTYCNACLEAGRYRPPQIAPRVAEAGPAIPPELLGPQNRWYLTLGVLGLLLFGIAMHMNWIGSLFWYYGPIYSMIGGPVSSTNPVTTTSLVLVGISITFVGTAFHAYSRALRSRLCNAAAIVSFLSAWWLLIADLLLYTGQVWQWDMGIWSRGSLQVEYVVILLTGQTLLGVTSLVWAGALIATRRQTRQRALAIASGVLFIIAAHLVILPLPFNAIMLLGQYLSYYYLPYAFSGNFWAACLLEPASILGAILMYRSRTPKCTY